MPLMAGTETDDCVNDMTKFRCLVALPGAGKSRQPRSIDEGPKPDRPLVEEIGIVKLPRVDDCPR